MMQHRMQLAANLRRLRKSRTWSQETLAHYAGLHATEVRRLERGMREPRISTIIHVAEALEVPVEELLAPPAAELGAMA
jgi:transcriptional regulator with XRE-family HTH domain